MNYATQDGADHRRRAAAGSDYTAASGTLNFAPGETAKTVKVPLINDTLPEGAEAFSLALSGLVGATALNPVGTAVIAANDETTVFRPNIWIDDVVVGGAGRLRRLRDPARRADERAAHRRLPAPATAPRSTATTTLLTRAR